MPFTVAFAGTPEFAVASLEALVRDPEFDVTLVITQPERPVGRRFALTAPAVKLIAEKHGITMLQPQNINVAFQESEMLRTRPDYLVVVAYGQILGKHVIEWPKIAAVNLHASLLPRWRGASPIEHAILSGDRESGVTVQQIVEKLDAGPILAQSATPLDPRETAVSLSPRLSKMGAELLCETLKQPLHPTAQNENDVTICRKLMRSDGRVDLMTMTAEEIDRRVRALHPWPGVCAVIHGKEVKILETSLDASSATALSLPCMEATTLFIEALQSPGGKALTGQEWERGHG